MINTVGIIGYGHFGKFLHDLGSRFFPEVEFRIYSRREEIDSQTFFDLKTVAQSDIVILCRAINEYEEQLISVLEHASSETIIVDVATVKLYTSKLLYKYCINNKFISIHPMFGPDSYKKYKGDVNGFTIVVTDYVLRNDGYQVLKDTFASLGFNIIEMTADEHDKRFSETLFLTHHVGKSILKAGFTRVDSDVLAFQFLMDAVESVAGDQNLFADMYKYNPYCKMVAERLNKAQKEVFEELE
ncbi:prephenate dehydrogenase/arogenate dehydrogenase family protein [Candidatus Nomurabacteria bacterium]|nr:prephenate dehydrogenase/arogenate dehydrogenase family protein [Candidatus Kaiserbacteria bacterium]MCB9814314.1 prephenate dehydrogenase/arogenate dehydrogenase family protein [Candidatus Nomurabacteria bacterium]